MVSREEWNAAEVNFNIAPLLRPIKRIIVAHTATETCEDEEDCKTLVQSIQNSDMNDRQLQDISFNFYIGGDGSILQGRGFQFQGQHSETTNGSSYNQIGIGVAFIGTFLESSPSEPQVEAFRDFICNFQSSGGITDEPPTLIFQDELVTTSVPTTALQNVLKNSFKNFFEFSEYLNCLSHHNNQNYFLNRKKNSQKR